MKTKFLLLTLALFSLSACESTRNDMIDVMNSSAHKAGKRAGG